MRPFPRRVRAEFSGRTVLDTRRGQLLCETGLPPQLHVPEEVSVVEGVQPAPGS